MNTKNLITNTGRGLASIAIASGLAGCNSGCENNPQPLQAEQAPKQITTDYFAKFPASFESGVGLNSGDYNEDGHLDLIFVGVATEGFRGSYGYSYFYAGDGKGNFTLEPKTITK